MQTRILYLSVIAFAFGGLLCGCGPSGDELFRQAQEAAENKDKGLAVELILKAADKGCYDAMIAAGGIYIHGEGVEPNKELGFSLIRKAAEAKHPDAMFALGKCYEYGTATAKDPDKARYWKDLAFQADSPMAMNAVADKIYQEIRYSSIIKRIDKGANRCSYSSKDKESMALAVKTFKRLVEEERFTNKVDVAYIYDRLGNIYAEGLAVNQSTRTAVAYYEKAIKLGSKMAMRDLGTIYCEGKICPKDYDKGVSLLCKSLGGIGDVRILQQLGMAYADPEWASSDLDTARRYFIDAIYKHDNSEEENKRDDYAIEQSLYWAGRILVFEDEKYRDEKRGIEYLKRAGKAGCNEADYFLAIAYCDGIGVEKDLIEADMLLGDAKYSRDKAIAAEAAKLHEEVRKQLHPRLSE